MAEVHLVVLECPVCLWRSVPSSPEVARFYADEHQRETGHAELRSADKRIPVHR